MESAPKILPIASQFNTLGCHCLKKYLNVHLRGSRYFGKINANSSRVILNQTASVDRVKKLIAENGCCTTCNAKGAVLCRTCFGSGQYVDSVMESQGVIVKVQCLVCGGAGIHMCEKCGGRGHL